MRNLAAKTFCGVILFCLALPVLHSEQPQTQPTSMSSIPPQQVEIARFAGNRVAAVSYTFDDGTLGHYTVAVPTLERYGFRGTFTARIHFMQLRYAASFM